MVLPPSGVAPSGERLPWAHAFRARLSMQADPAWAPLLVRLLSVVWSVAQAPWGQPSSKPSALGCAVQSGSRQPYVAPEFQFTLVHRR